MMLRRNASQKRKSSLKHGGLKIQAHKLPIKENISEIKTSVTIKSSSVRFDLKKGVVKQPTVSEESSNGFESDTVSVLSAEEFFRGKENYEGSPEPNPGMPFPQQQTPEFSKNNTSCTQINTKHFDLEPVANK